MQLAEEIEPSRWKERAFVFAVAEELRDSGSVAVLHANLDQHKIFPQGIDAPEKTQPFFQRSKENQSYLDTWGGQRSLEFGFAAQGFYRST